MATNVNPDHLANLKEPVVLRFEHLKVTMKRLNQTLPFTFPTKKTGSVLTVIKRPSSNFLVNYVLIAEGIS